MHPITLRLPEDMADDLAEEAENHGFSSRSEYVRHILRNRSGTDPTTDTYSERSPSDYNEVRDRLDALEAAVFGENTPEPVENGGSRDARPTPDGAETPSRDVDTAGMDSFRADLGEWLAENGPRTEHGRRGVLRCVDELEARGPLTSEALTDVLEDEIGENYSRRKSMWESVKRWLKDTPGVHETENYSEWAFAGVDEARAEL